MCLKILGIPQAEDPKKIVSCKDGKIDRSVMRVQTSDEVVSFILHTLCSSQVHVDKMSLR